MKSFLLAWALALLSLPAAAETDVSIYGGPSGMLPQDVKVRDFDQPGRQVWWQEHHVKADVESTEGVNLRHFFGPRLGVQGEFNYSQSKLSPDLVGTRFTNFDMYQQRYMLMLSVVGRHRMRRLGLSSIYGTCGLGGVYADYTAIPNHWVLGGKFAIGADLASSRRSNLFVELDYIWHGDVGDREQDPGQRLKTSGSPSLNPATFIVGPHYDTSIIALVLGLRFKMGDVAQK